MPGHEINYDVTKLIQIINDLNKHRQNPKAHRHLMEELPFLRSAHSLLGILIHGIASDPVDLRAFVEAAE